MTKRIPARAVLRPFFAMLLGVAAMLTTGTATAGEPNAPPSRFSVEIVGQGPDVILIPGLSTPREVWQPAAGRLKSRYRLHLVQVKGFGEEAGPNAEGPVLGPLVEELADYIATEGLDRPAVVGHSLGGLSALMLAADHGELVGRIMIVDALPWYGVLALPPGSDGNVATMEPRARAIRDQMAATWGQPANPQAVTANARGQVNDPANLPLVEKWIAAADPRVTGQLAYDDRTTDMRQRVGDVSVPVTLVVPWNETYPTRAQAEPFYRSQYAGLAGLELVAIGPSGHFVMLDQPEQFHVALDAFLAD